MILGMAHYQVHNEKFGETFVSFPIIIDLWMTYSHNFFLNFSRNGARATTLLINFAKGDELKFCQRLIWCIEDTYTLK